jgi:hypothetical protein
MTHKHGRGGVKPLVCYDTQAIAAVLQRSSNPTIGMATEEAPVDLRLANTSALAFAANRPLAASKRGR